MRVVCSLAHAIVFISRCYFIYIAVHFIISENKKTLRFKFKLRNSGAKS